MNGRLGPLAVAALGSWLASAADFSTPHIEHVACAGIDVAGALCGMLRVPEVRGAPEARSIGLFFAVMPANGIDPLRDPLFFFYGGPGVAASDEIQRAVAQWHKMRAQRDLVFIDQRGTGRSAPLHCTHDGDPGDPNTYAIDLFDLAFLRAGRDRHAATHDLTQYATADAVQDAEAVRAALGYERINLVGESYGTRVVQEYVRRYPSRTRSALLMGAVPPSASITEGMAVSLDATLAQLFASCESDRACTASYPDLRARTTALLERLRTGSLSSEISLDQGDPREATISYHQALAWIRSRLYSVQESARLPRILSQAARGDARELVRGAIRWRRGLSRLLSEGMYESVACAEDMPFVDVRAETGAANGTWLQDHRVASQQAACTIWPRATIPDDFKAPLASTTPMLVINGDRDPATSLDWARKAVAGLPHARLVVARNRSHDLGHEREACLGPIAERFVGMADVAAIDDSCTRELRLPPFETESRG